MHYDFVPLPERKPLRWPNGRRLALMITLNLEYWELTQDHDGPYFAGGPSINERLLPARIPDFNNHSWREYGHRVGIWRLYEAFDEAGVPASCTVNGILCERHPHIIGRAFRVRALREFLDYVKMFDGVWWATREEIADWYLANHARHIG
jgi:peptidoglycan/xylan/chitin deacetylase (PgdA/CDA1 family)